MLTDEIKAVVEADRRNFPDVPYGTITTLRLYHLARIPPGGFMTAVLSNDLRGACERADDQNRRLLFETVSYIYNALPARCWGSPEAVRDWLKKN